MQERRAGGGIVLCLLLLAPLCPAECSGEKADPPDLPAPTILGPSWFKEVVFYQIYPRSFKDSNGDGIGDLQGIVTKLDYLQDLGVGALWLNPIYPTANADLGYDIKNHRGINPEFGSIDDFSRLLEEAHSRNMRVFLDLVLDYTSDEHPWFQQSRARPSSPRRAWYVWAQEPAFECDDILTIGNPFGSSRWTLDPLTGEYYYHQFYDRMPDLNFENADVRAELIDIARYWLEDLWNGGETLRSAPGDRPSLTVSMRAHSLAIFRIE